MFIIHLSFIIFSTTVFHSEIINQE